MAKKAKRNRHQHQPVGVCRLCQRQRELCDSHILPSWCFKRLLLGGREKQFVRLGEGKIIAGNDNLTESLLCAACERILKIDEDYVAAVSRKNDGRFLAREALRPIPLFANSPARDANALDTLKVARFALGVFWRASVSRQFRLALFPSLEDQLRLFLLEQKPLPDSVTLVLSVLLPADPAEAPVDQLLTAPSELKDFGDCHAVSLVVFGLSFRFILNNTTGQNPTFGQADLLKSTLVLLSDGSAEWDHWLEAGAKSMPVGGNDPPEARDRDRRARVMARGGARFLAGAPGRS